MHKSMLVTSHKNGTVPGTEKEAISANVKISLLILNMQESP